MPRGVTPPPFAPGAPKLWTIPPGEAFLDRLADTLAGRFDLRNDPAALADALIYVPNRRSARALAFALYRAAGGGAILPPEIRALGDLESDDPPTGAEEALAGLGPALSPGRRLGALARLVAAYYNAQGLALPPAGAIAAARELSGLLDQAALAGGVDWSRLATLVSETDLAVHWRRSVDFLAIVAEAWPAWLDEEGASEPFERRLEVAEAVAEHWRAHPPETPIIIAGSTGATPASRALMQAALGSPTGLVVLPGLDTDPDTDWTAIAAAPDHPQHALGAALATLGAKPPEAAMWPGAGALAGVEARRRLIHEALAPADATADWLTRLSAIAAPRPPAEFALAAFEGLSLIEAADEAEEARCAAVLLRETLETPGRTAALVTPDAGLARRVAALMRRWGVEITPSAGTPLPRTAAGSFLLLALDWALDPGDPAALCAVLKHPLCAADAAAVSELERGRLRGPRRWGGLAGVLDGPFKPSPIVRELATWLRRAWTAFEAAKATPVDAWAGLAETLAGGEDALWFGPDGAAAARWLETLSDVENQIGPLDLEGLRDVAAALATGETVASGEAGHPRLAIWGPLEARLQRADRIILAGLNEGVWPAIPSADGFLPRRFRPDLGLAAPEARLGLAAHDFAQLACAPDVVMLHAARRDDAPAIASRWIWRLKTLAEGALGRPAAAAALAPGPETDPRPWARSLLKADQTRDPKAAVPSPRPPVAARPKRLSVTRIDALQRDPYAVYARDILKLQPLDPLNAPVTPAHLGTAIHAALEGFETVAETGLDGLVDLLERHLIAAGEPRETVAGRRAVLRRTAAGYLAWRAARRPETLFLEVGGALDIEIAGAPFRLIAKADRIEATKGGLAVIDFKTGAPPTRKQIDAGLEQQMPLQGLIARAGGFDGVRAGGAELIYIAFRGACDIRPVAGPEEAAALADAAEAGLKTLLTGYANPAQPYYSKPIAQFEKAWDDYDRLARRLEWLGEDEG